ncbi:MAG TPA: ABC transporter substrate-binding protein/permease [Bdellovibrionales bacterium]|nr:ABC transporter substrate-binding protein/permease [Bdellovibrionales bacterium]
MIRLLAAIFVLQAFVSCTPCYAKGVLRWGADIESGAPFSYKDPEDPNKIIGYEAEIVAAVARELGLEVEFRQNNWEGLIEGLKRGDYDVVVNGLEITPDRAAVVNFSQPYYVTAAILAVDKDNDDIKKFADIEGKRVGTLAGTLPQRILSAQEFPFSMVTYSEEVHAYNDLAIDRLDAVFMDEPIALYYGKPNPRLKIVGEPVGRLEYGFATRLDDRKLTTDIRRAIQTLIENGELRLILERWGLWNETTAKQFQATPAPAQTPAVAYDAYVATAFKSVGWKERFARYVSFLPLLAKGALMTLQISVIAMALAILVGLLTALARLYGPRPLAWLAVAFVEVFRGTPLLIQLFLIFYGLPHIGIRFDPFVAAVLGLGLNYGASEAENYRAGILSIPKAQMDAAQALGLSRAQSLRHIILPQAVRVVIPPVTNDFIALLKDSSLVSVITMVELTATYGQLASTYFDYLGVGLLAAAVYFLIGLPFVRLSRYFEARGSRHHG